MTGPHPETESAGNRQISVAELLARQGVTGAPARRRRRRRGDSDAITVAELTGEIPIIRDDHHHAGPDAHASQSPAANGRVQVGEAAPPSPPEPVAEQVAEEPTRTVYWSQPEPRWPKSPPQDRRESGPELSEYPRPLRHTDSGRAPAGPPSGAEHMSPDPVEHYADLSADLSVDVLDAEVREAEPGRGERHAAAAGTDVEGDGAAEAPVARRALDVVPTLWRGTLIVLQSILAVAFGAGLFIAFDQLWRWNSIVALVLSVMVILGLVVSVRAVRKTEDIASTLIAVAVGALITLGPLALLQSG
ncbi:hypothetical protein [Mycobacterium canetti]|uniref:hypothetical protein n=1 Tax=Mycobacterium canetti TaxID=78331 RepID=UPI0002A55EA5|nr:hypothetical protein [Mycobacterium canetti]CCK58511.1 Conserved membrane protein of unknown function [Mycobacterium canettii CIPT 140070010]